MKIGAETKALVTGASRGIGLATAEALAERSATVGLLARSGEELEEHAARVPGAVAVAADVTELESLRGAVDGFRAEAGGLDLVVANAGIAHYGPFADQPVEQAEQMVAVNVLGTIYTVAAALPHLLGQASGHVVVVSSGAGLRAFPWGAVYGATKAAGRGFAEALRHELSGTGVSVSAVLPGEIETHLHDHQSERMPDWRDSANALPADRVAEAILAAVEDDRREVHVPQSVRVLGLNGVAPGLVDRLLRAARGGSAAPRR
ncbi:MAG TPA: SDR family oxidoreductase [Solirubrobacterales bacterium]|nr:SDR family oxidoreductase [Solirubrobacterales bacterium]